MKVKVTVFGRIPYEEIFEVTGEYKDDLTQLEAEVNYLLEHKLLREYISGFSVMRVERED